MRWISVSVFAGMRIRIFLAGRDNTFINTLCNFKCFLLNEFLEIFGDVCVCVCQVYSP